MDRSDNYELAFHINPNLEEGKILAIKQDLEKLVIGHNGVISYSKDPERTRLSYQIDHTPNTFFGYIHFKVPNPEELLTILQEHIKLESNIIRSLILKLPSDKEKNKALMTQLKRRERFQKATPPAGGQVATPEDQEKMEEQIKEVIEKL